MNTGYYIALSVVIIIWFPAWCSGKAVALNQRVCGSNPLFFVLFPPTVIGMNTLSP